MIIQSPNQIRLCRSGSCCPILERQDNEFTLTDDFNGKVKLSKEELTILKEAIEHFEKQV